MPVLFLFPLPAAPPTGIELPLQALAAAGAGPSLAVTGAEIHPSLQEHPGPGNHLVVEHPEFREAFEKGNLPQSGEEIHVAQQAGDPFLLQPVLEESGLGLLRDTEGEQLLHGPVRRKVIRG